MDIEYVIRESGEIIWEDKEDAESVRILSKYVYFLGIEYRIHKTKAMTQKFSYKQLKSKNTIGYLESNNATKSKELAERDAITEYWNYDILDKEAEAIKAVSEGIVQYINWVKRKTKSENVSIDYSRDDS